MNEVPIIEEGFWVVIPHEVLSNKNLKDIDKLVYGEISSLTRKSGFCTAHNAHFQDVLNISESKLQRSLQRLENEGCITVQLTHILDDKKGTYRKVFLRGVVTSDYTGVSELTTPGSQERLHKIDIHTRDTVENISYKKEYDSFLREFNTLVSSSYKGSDKVYKKFCARIKDGYTLKEILKAVESAKGNAFLMGENDSKKRYLTPEYILREDKLDEWFNSDKKEIKLNILK